MDHFLQIKRELILKNPWYSIYLDQVAVTNQDDIMAYYVQKFANDSVAAVVSNQQGEFLFVEAYRYLTNEISLEIPAGSADSGESLIDAAKRECLEETGFTVTLEEHFQSYYPSNGVTDHQVHLFFGKVEEQAEPVKYDEKEIAQVRWLSMEEIIAKIKQNEITDGLTLTAMLLMLCDFCRG